MSDPVQMMTAADRHALGQHLQAVLASGDAERWQQELRRQLAALGDLPVNSNGLGAAEPAFVPKPHGPAAPMSTRGVDPLSTCILILDGAGLLQSRSDGPPPWPWGDADTLAMGTDGLAVCREAAQTGDPVATRLLHGVEAVQRGQQPAFTLEYAYPALPASRWITLTVVPLPGPSGSGAGILLQDHTHCKHLEVALEDSRSRLQALLDHIPAMIWMKDLEQRYQLLNPCGEAWFGRPASQLLGKTAREVLPTALAETFEALDQRVIDSGILQVAEHELPRPEGNRTVRSTQFPIRNRAGQLLAIGGVAFDISAHKQAEAALQTALHDSRTFSALLEHGDQAFAVAYPDGRIGLTNAAFARLIGYAPDELTRLDWRTDLTPPEWQSLEQRRLAQLDETCPSVRYEKEYWRKDGTRIPIELLVQRGPEGPEAPFYYGFITDLTERRRAEAALLAVKQRLEAHMDNSPLAVLEWNPHQKVISWSRGAERLFGWSAAEIVGRTVMERHLIHPDDLGAVNQIMADLISGRKPRSTFQNRNLCKDGRVLECAWYNSALYTTDGQLSSLLSFGLDITAQRRDEAELRDADQRKDEFLARLAHELRNPLAAVRNAVQLLGREGLTAAQHRWCRDVVDRQSRYLAALVDDLLDVSRIRRGKVMLQRSPTDLAAILRQATETSQPLVEAAQHTLAVQLPSEALTLDADPLRLTQVFVNLLSNAAKYTPPGGRIRLRAERVADTAVVTVQDSGIGIAAAMLPRIFELFIQVEGSQEQSQGGLGIGLSLVRSLVALHGGCVEAQSEGEGAGSTFTVRLPLKDPASRQDGEDGAGIMEKLGLRLLVVDDNSDVADSFVLLLNTLADHVDVVYDGTAALDAIDRYRPDVVFLDLGMPGLDGYGVAQRIRERPEGKAMTLIAVTGWGQTDDYARTEAAGFDFHLIKPVDIDALEALLKSFPGRP